MVSLIPFLHTSQKGTKKKTAPVQDREKEERAFNKYHVNSPVNREMVRLMNNKINVSRNTVYNWFVKGFDHLKKLLPLVKEKLLAKGAVVNCDEIVFYHTLIKTSKMCDVSTLEYFKDFFKAIMQGRNDFERSALPLCLQRICYR